MKTGVYRYIRHDELLFRLHQGWKWVADLGDVHGELFVADEVVLRRLRRRLRA